MNATPFTSIGMEILPAQVSLIVPLARLLKERYGAKLHLYVRSHVEEETFRRNNADGLWDSVTNDSIHLQALRAEGLVEEDVIARARHVEELTGEPINRLALATRQTGHPFSPGAWRHPNSPFAERASNLQLMHAITESVAFWEKEIDEKELSLVLDGNKFMAAAARAKGVAYRRLTLARFETYFYWAVNEYFDHPGLKEAYDSLASWPAAEIGGSYAFAAQKYKMEKRLFSWRRIVRILPESILYHFYYKMRGMEKGLSTNLLRLIALPFRIRHAHRHLARLATTSLNDLENRQFVYYPLQKEPEVTIMQSAPECLSQHATILSLARDLPAGVLLAIKENTSAIGRRTASFYDQIAALKNVVLLRADTSSIDAIKQAAATVTIAGTASMEAAILGKPAITFSKHVKWGFLPHARIVKSESELPSLLRWAVSGPFDADQAREDGARFLAALKDSSMNLEGFRRDGRGRYHSDEEDIAPLYAGLCKSLDVTPMEATPEKIKAKVA
ncbi:MAG: hypothetical protein ISR48_07870 [Alphaproteobacteria bacterium]|nr:hypothetical protein [Alphaproteobacteria bacterium]